jgi:hypothetical protein
MQVRFFNVVWDTDGENVDLPQDIVLDVPEATNLEQEGANFLSDAYGWLVESCSFTVLTDTPSKQGE